MKGLSEKAAAIEGSVVSRWSPGVGRTSGGEVAWWHIPSEPDDRLLQGLDLDGSEVSPLAVPLPDGSPSSRVVMMCGGESLVTVGRLPHSHEHHCQQMEQIWIGRAETLRTSGDLGLLVLEELLREYTAVRRSFARELARIEDKYLSAVAGLGGAQRLDTNDRGPIQELLELRTRISAVYQGLEPINRPGMERSLDRVWFPGTTDRDESEAVDDVLDRTLRSLRGLRSQVGESIDVCATLAGAEHAHQLDRLQTAIGVIGAFVLWPTLVFGFFGANTNLPGRDETSGLVIMLVVSAIGIALALALLRTFRRRQPNLLGNTDRG